jgi:hypothetical protein
MLHAITLYTDYLIVINAACDALDEWARAKGGVPIALRPVLKSLGGADEAAADSVRRLIRDVKPPTWPTLFASEHLRTIYSGLSVLDSRHWASAKSNEHLRTPYESLRRTVREELKIA